MERERVRQSNLMIAKRGGDLHTKLKIYSKTTRESLPYTSFVVAKSLLGYNKTIKGH